MSRSLDDLDSRFRPLADELLRRARAAGIRITVTDTLRTPEEQREALRLGRSRTLNSKHLPQAPDGKSLAMDIAPVEYLRIKLWNPGGPLWAKLGEIGEGLGLRWGGRWTNYDPGHFEWQRQAKPAQPIITNSGARTMAGLAKLHLFPVHQEPPPGAPPFDKSKPIKRWSDPAPVKGKWKMYSSVNAQGEYEDFPVLATDAGVLNIPTSDQLIGQSYEEMPNPMRPLEDDELIVPGPTPLNPWMVKTRAEILAEADEKDTFTAADRVTLRKIAEDVKAILPFVSGGK